ncbi:MAG: hypothetical protein IPP48_09285 [Chitinophagaceae bacterium]|nr:hypothetical protein [Chitinophagaceae bacterium]
MPLCYAHYYCYWVCTCCTAYFEFIIPVYNTTTQVKKKVGEMQQKMHEQMQQQQNGYNATTPKQPAEKPKRDDYIDFEEVKQG